MSVPKFKLRFSDEASGELEHAAHWYEDNRKGLGTEFLNSIDATIASIRRTPMLFRVVHRDVRRALIKRFPYALYFRFEGDTVDILSVFHTKRDLNALKKRL